MSAWLSVCLPLGFTGRSPRQNAPEIADPLETVTCVVLLQTLWHAVPIVGIPGMMDQPWNCRKADYWGFGISLPSIYTVKEVQLKTALSRVLSEPSFKQGALQAQARLRSGKSPGVVRAVGKPSALGSFA